MAELDGLIPLCGHQNRSEAIRDLTRASLRQAAGEAHSDRPCVAALVYVYDHATWDLAKRLADTFPDHHDLSVSTPHVHLDHDTCMEVTMLKGQRAEVRHFAEHFIAERGVRHGQLVMVPDAADVAGITGIGKS